MPKKDEENQPGFATQLAGTASSLANKAITMMRLVKFKLTKSTGVLGVTFDFVANWIDANNETYTAIQHSSLNFAVSSMINNKLTFPVFSYYRFVLSTTAISKIFLTDVATSNLWALTPLTNKHSPRSQDAVFSEKLKVELQQCITMPSEKSSQHHSKLFRKLAQIKHQQEEAKNPAKTVVLLPNK